MTNGFSLLARPPVKWASVAKKALEQESRKQELETKRQKVYRSYEYSSLESYKRMNNSGRLRLQSLEGAFRYLFEHSDVKLGYMQQRLIEQTTVAYLKNMFALDLVSNLKFLCRKFLITELFDTLAVLFPRRSGKTVGCAIMIAVIAVSQPNGNCVMYNLTAAQAEEFITEVMYERERERKDFYSLRLGST